MPLSKVNIRWGYLIALFLMLISYALIFYIIKRLAHETTLISDSYSVINNLESIEGEITEAETGVRGYIITGEVSYLKSYNSAHRRIEPLIKHLLSKLGDQQSVKAQVQKLNELVNARLGNLQTAISDYQLGGNRISERMLARRGANKLTMDNIHSIISSLQEREKLVMSRRDSKLKSFFTSTEVVTITSLIIALITVIYSVLVYNRENKAKEIAIRESRGYSQQLEERVTELAKVNAELQELRNIEKFAATGRIARTMAHEVRNPLTNISLASEQLKEIVSEDEEGSVLLEMIGRNVNRINQLVSDLLHSTRFAQLEYTFADLNELLDETLELAADRIELNDIEVQKSYATDLTPVYVDQEKIKLAFLNIIVNAMEAMENTSGVLQIKTRKSGDKCLIEIRDNGIGMDEETIQRLFEPYFTGKLKGNGLGLTNTQNIIFNHKGQISVRSRVGNGSTFTITLNLRQEEIKENT